MPLILYKNKVGKSNEMNDYQKFIHKQTYQEIFVQKEISRLTHVATGKYISSNVVVEYVYCLVRSATIAKSHG